MARSVALLLIVLGYSIGWAQIDFEKPPISYGQAISEDPVARWVKSRSRDSLDLTYDKKLGWLPGLLKSLDIDPDSQVFVFSKTSLQLHKINPRQPRAIYFNDDVYIGFCQNGEVLEIAATDPQLGAVFYTLDQDAQAREIVADRGQCLTCHATNRTQNVPGYLVRSVFSDFNGRPRSGTRTFVTDHSTQFAQRFGGWYITGEHGSMRHMGNIVSRDRHDPEKMDFEVGANLQDLSQLFDTGPYLTPNSDLVAMMVLEHQTQMHNLLARASMETRSAIYHDRGINQALGRPIDTMSESTERRIARAAEDVVRYMLMVDEFQFDCAVRGNTRFAQNFAARSAKSGQVDSKGRHLRDFDLTHRLFKYPCSYLIYSEAFQRLPPPMYDRIRLRLLEILTSKEPLQGYETLSADGRQVVLEILNSTLPHLFKDLPAAPLAKL